MKTAILETAAGNPENQDRGAVIESRVGLVMVVADGAGGQSGGARAASMAVDYVREHTHELETSDACVNLLHAMDQVIAKDGVAGETTCVVAVVSENDIYGASVGDSGAWIIIKNGILNLTQRQAIKPFIGSGAAWAAPFSSGRTRGERLLLATDGLLKYTSPDRIASACVDGDLAHCARKLIELVRYPSGGLPDDVTVVAQL